MDKSLIKLLKLLLSKLVLKPTLTIFNGDIMNAWREWHIFMKMLNTVYTLFHEDMSKEQYLILKKLAGLEK